MLLWKGDHSSITSANWFVPTNSINSVKEKQLNRDRHRGQGEEEHCPFCRQPDLDYIPVKFGFTCGSGRTGLSLWTEAIYVRLGATETSEPHGDSCYTNTDSHQWFTSLLPPLWLALFGNGLVERRAVQSSQNTGCNFWHSLYFRLQQDRTQSTWFWWKYSRWAPIHVLHSPWSPQSHLQSPGFVKCAAPVGLVSSPMFSSWGTAWFLHPGQSPVWTESSNSYVSCSKAHPAADTDTTCTWIWIILWSLKDLRQCLVPDLWEHTRNIHLKAHPNF